MHVHAPVCYSHKVARQVPRKGGKKLGKPNGGTNIDLSHQPYTRSHCLTPSSGFWVGSGCSGHI